MLALIAVAVAISACGSSSRSADTLTVYAAASLQEPFTRIADMFEAETGIPVTFSFAGSSDLVAQLEHGAPADVFASADERTMTTAVDAGLVAADPVPFATNTQTVVTAPGNPRGIASWADLADDDLAVVVCAPQVPCGAATVRLEDVTGIALTPVSEESSVTDVLAKVTSGQADAGAVYVTDALAAGDDVTVVPVPEASGIVNTYPIARLESATDAARADEFVRFVTGATGRSVLEDAGFGTP